jgi:hypothetical protein
MLLLAEIFLTITPKTESTKAKINKRNSIKLKSFCTGKKIMKRKAMDGEKIVANHISDKE